ncbi:Zinc finger, C3HC4 RING-type [Dillenia turbinata]|uniref:RING-type E3 ubiquitin transferase n=1 Tax=Dillenia turbinata TaxID=194707 RepID=A0AAN8Z1R5_9MAGN
MQRSKLGDGGAKHGKKHKVAMKHLVVYMSYSNGCSCRRPVSFSAPMRLCTYSFRLFQVEVLTDSAGIFSFTLAVVYIDKLREEPSCAICLEICFEPNTTPCGHGFCKKCLRSAADKCGKRCPKCRKLISNGRSCTVNTVLWNTIQLLFPQEVEARKAAAVASNSQERAAKNKSPIRNNHGNENQHRHIRFLRESNRGEGSSNGQEGELRRLRNGSLRNRSTRASRHSSRDVSERRRTEMPEQDVDVALALWLQREEFMEAFEGTDEPERPLGKSQFKNHCF